MSTSDADADEEADDRFIGASEQQQQQKQQQQPQQPAADRFKLVYEPSPVVPPDGGYGWAVVAAAFVVNLIADGVTFSFGILLSELFGQLDDSREDISWIGSFLAGVPLLLGPVTSVLIDRFGCRAVTVAGGLISGVGFGLMFVLPQSTLLFVFSAGLLTGLGLGLCYMPAVVAVSFYFVEKRALATGLSASGSGVGTVVFAYITRACIESYTWRGSFLVIAGILLNICVCGVIYRPLEPSDFKEMKRMNKLYIQFQASSSCGHHHQRRHRTSASGGSSSSLDSSASGGDSPSGAAAAASGSSASSASPTSQRHRGAAAAAAAGSKSTLAAAAAAAAAGARSLLSIPTYLAWELSQLRPPHPSPTAAATAPPPDEKQLIAGLKLGYLRRLAAAVSNDATATVHGTGVAGVNGGALGGGHDEGPGGVITKANTSHELVDYAQQISRQQHRQHQEQRRLEKQQQQEQQQQQQEEPTATRRMSIIVSLPQSQLLHVHHQQQPQQRPRLNTASQTVRRQLFPVDRRYFMQHTRRSIATVELWDSCPELGRGPGWIHAGRHNESSPRSRPSLPLAKLQRRVAHSKAFKDLKFLFTSWDYVFFLASNFLLYFWYDITYTFLPDHAKEIGLTTSQVSLIIALIGVSNTIGQIVIGYIGDFPSVDTSVLYALCMSLTGVANFLVPWCLSLGSLLVYGIVYGFLVSANYSLCSIVIIDLFGIERLTTGYGFMMFFQGLANLVGPPAMGHMRDLDADYNRSFVYSGIFVLASNLLILQLYRAAYRSIRARCCQRQGDASVVDNDAEAAGEATAVPLTTSSGP